MNYTLNEFNSNLEKTNGISFTPGIIVAYNLTEKLNIHSGIYLSTIFNKLKVTEEFVIPQSYVVDDNNLI